MATKSKQRVIKPRSHRNLPRGARHPASLLPFTAHCPALLALVDTPVHMEMVLHVAKQAVHAIRVEGEEEGDSISSTSPARMDTSLNGQQDATQPPPTTTPTEPTAKVVPLEKFIAHVVRSSNVDVPILLTTLIYLERLRVRVFLATLIVAAKYLNDVSPKNKHWALHAGNLFPLREVNLMERQLLYLLEFDLKFNESDALREWKPFCPLTPPYDVTTTLKSNSLPTPTSTKTSALRSTASVTSMSSMSSMALPSDLSQKKSFNLRPIPEQAYKRAHPLPHPSFSVSTTGNGNISASSSGSALSVPPSKASISSSVTMPVLYYSPSTTSLTTQPQAQSRSHGSFLARMWSKGFRGTHTTHAKENLPPKTVPERSGERSTVYAPAPMRPTCSPCAESGRSQSSSSLAEMRRGGGALSTSTSGEVSMAPTPLKGYYGSQNEERGKWAPSSSGSGEVSMAPTPLKGAHVQSV
ncbi:hypothetical protein BDQ17DRAFT_1354620 [Cyathus striatus]|nr:hypothetical protein BDQ17DRAFT_1354620 [Cyathus striatus]